MVKAKTPQKVTNLLRYPGGKFRARKILESMLPEDIALSNLSENFAKVGSPFFGGGSFEIHLKNNYPRISLETADAFGVLVNFWEETINNQQELCEIVSNFHKNGVTSEIFKKFQKELTKIDEDLTTGEKVIGDGTENWTEVAAKFYVVNRCSFSGATLSGGFSKASAETRLTESSIENVKNFDASNFSISLEKFETSLPKMNKTCDFLFLDPPYLLEKNELYGVKGNQHNSFNHAEMFEEVKKLTKPFMITYNNEPILVELYKDFSIVETSWKYGMNASKESSEIIIKNY